MSVFFIIAFVLLCNGALSCSLQI